jgi:hypothetical protein
MHLKLKGTYAPMIQNNTPVNLSCLERLYWYTMFTKEYSSEPLNPGTFLSIRNTFYINFLRFLFYFLYSFIPRIHKTSISHALKFRYCSNNSYHHNTILHHSICLTFRFILFCFIFISLICFVLANQDGGVAHTRKNILFCRLIDEEGGRVLLFSELNPKSHLVGKVHLLQHYALRVLTALCMITKYTELVNLVFNYGACQFVVPIDRDIELIGLELLTNFGRLPHSSCRARLP